ncbi:MAG: hypothetical protein IH978_06280 [Nitrospinae bacterium]|nr:hypothetical protein [Nitrospinota bacterium]
MERLTVINSEEAKNRIAALAPCQPGVSAPKQGKLFLREPLSRVDMAKGAQWVSVECFRKI